MLNTETIIRGNRVRREWRDVKGRLVETTFILDDFQDRWLKRVRNKHMTIRFNDSCPHGKIIQEQDT